MTRNSDPARFCLYHLSRKSLTVCSNILKSHGRFRFVLNLNLNLMLLIAIV